MSFLTGIGSLKKERLENLVPALNKLTSDKSVLNKINTSLSLIRTAKLTSEERIRIPSDYSDILDLTDFNKAWCWINCSMRINTLELRKFKQLIDSFKKTNDVLESMIKTNSPISEIKEQFILFVNMRINLNNLKAELQQKYPPIAAKMINNPPPKEGAESGTPQWADPLARIYSSIGGPKNVNTSTFIKHFQNHRNELSAEQQSTVHGTLSEFGSRRNNTAVALKNYLSKTKSALPPSFRSIFRANQFSKTAKGGRRARKRGTRKH